MYVPGRYVMYERKYVQDKKKLEKKKKTSKQTRL